MKDQLFLLRPGFGAGDGGPFYCRDCALVEGLLSFFPMLRDDVDITYIDAARPRRELVALLGDAHQSAPVLVLAKDAEPRDRGVAVERSQGRAFIDDEAMIRSYLSSQYGLPKAS